MKCCEIGWKGLSLRVLLATVCFAPFRGASAEDPPPAPTLAVRPPRRGAPSVPGLDRFSPRRVPGVGQLRGAFSPCLTADLKTIVFANWKNRETQYDLYIATRDALDKPFGPAERIEACTTPWTESSPALSADGLELVYTSADDAHPQILPKLLWSRRSETGMPFPAPEEVSLPTIDSTLLPIYNPQLIDQLRLKFSLVESDTVRPVRVAARAGKSEPFEVPVTLPLENHWLQWWIYTDELRGYGGTDEGICLSYRDPRDAMFGPSDVVLPTRLVGTIDGPIWLAPQEDVLFYCSAGPDAKRGGRYLWMIAF